ncbi:hybrid sensor histidine kinase/response regulator [Endobacterium cereale]|uniref:hybrid sensor histidine kinase/response regulator n=1 Tax=Endobacterium cereale TaxID=2663029 RepID=UPI002B46032C|nr:hybrid sensor histidine kinase/response regulator [Endobacterium cereale]MEB2844811.1 hybrid sensor histidine kinase/response regulator [Endobacterium cereale]
MQNRLIAAFGAPAPSEEERARDDAAAPIAFPKQAVAETPPSPAWLNFFSRLGSHRGAPVSVAAPPIDPANLADALGEVAVTRTVDGRIVDANGIFRRLTRCDAPEGRTLEGLGFRARAQSAQPIDLAEPTLTGRDLEITGPSGFRIFWWRDVPVRDADSNVMLHGFARDVTEERLAREEQEVARLKAEALNLTKSRQLATVVHELRTPLNGILGMGQLLGRTHLSPEQQNYIGGIRQAGQALAQLVDDLLDYSTMEAGRFKLNTRAENLRQLIESVMEMVAPRAHEKQVEIGATVMSDLPDLHDFDPARLRQVLFNVIGNAVKFTQTGGVLIRAWPETENVIITVSDTGPGMTAEEQARIFGEFEQAGTAEARSGGTGLGMAISHRIVQEFGGSLSVESEKGVGSTFTIRLPLAPTESAAAFVEGTRAQPSGRAEALRPSRVLLLAPQGPSSSAIIGLIETLGGTCIQVGSNAEAERRIEDAGRGADRFTDLIVDHRLAGGPAGTLVHDGLRRILLVNPEDRGSQPQELYDAWLIRPLRERTLIDVLRGRLGGREPAAATLVETPGSAPTIETRATAQPGLSIVLAEDDAVSAMLYATILKRSGHTVTRVADFPSLLSAACGDTPPDLVISDMHMPGGEIIEALGNITSASSLRGQNLPVIILTGESRESQHAQVISAGAAHVMEKPVTPDALLSSVRQFGTAAMRQAS